jgi:hypothetical protein
MWVKTATVVDQTMVVKLLVFVNVTGANQDKISFFDTLVCLSRVEPAHTKYIIAYPDDGLAFEEFHV